MSRQTKHKKASKSRMYNRVGTILLLIGVCCVLYGFKDSIKSWVLRGSVNDEVTTTLEDVTGYNKEIEKEDKTTIWEYPEDKHVPTKMREENIKEHASKGALIIPKIEETLAIMDGVGGNNMYRGAGEQYLDQKMGVGNYVLSSHRMYDGSLFGDLEQVAIGDEVYITDYKKVWKYRVTDSNNQVKTSQTELLADTEEPVLTIYGCNDDGTMRVVKRAELVGYADMADLGEEDIKLININ